MNPSSRFAAPHEQGRALVGGTHAAGTDAQRDAAIRNVQRRGFPAAETTELLRMLGLADPGFAWVGPAHGRKRVPR